MVQFIPPPDAQALLPPILACIPTAFVSPRPPPALLPLLSPILRQRLQYLTSSSTSPSDSWLPYLCWNADLAKQLVDLVSDSDAFEPHPTSGQIEIGDIEPVKYRRLDPETLHARLALPDTQLEIIFVWRSGEEGEEDSNVWLVAEIKPLKKIDQQEWHNSVTEAEEAERRETFEDATKEVDERPANEREGTGAQDESDDDDDYWAQYDKTPARTPGHNRTPTTTEQGRRGRSTSEAEYFDRYAEVQPEMDNDDPSQEKEAAGHSSLNGNELTTSSREDAGSMQSTGRGSIPQPSSSLDPPSEVSLSNDLVTGNSDQEDSMAVAAVRQHASSNLKSLFKLCRGVGMDRTEFEDLVKTELQMLSLLDDA